MGELIGIGRFSNLTDLSPRLLRKLDERGLLSPVHVDPETRYRFYDHTQTRRASLILMCRRMGMPLGEVGELLDDDPDAVRRRLEAHRTRITRRLADDARILALLERELSRDEQPLDYAVAVKDVPAQLVAGRQGRVARVHPHDPYLVESGIEAAADVVYERLAAQRIQPLGPVIVLYHTGLETGDEMAFEVCVPVPRPVLESGEVCCRELPASQVAFATHRGAYDTIWHAHAAVLAWVAENDVDVAGPGCEVGLVSAQDTDDPDEWVTEVSLPIASRG